MEPLGGEREANENPKVPSNHKDSPDEVVQDQHVSAPSIPAPILNFDGIPFPGVVCNCAPPDTDGEVGLTQYVQIVNEGYQVFNKTTGASVLGPVGISSIWGGFGGVCETAGHGDPIVLYDQLANRWLISQFAGSPPTDECIAISTTSDATGSYNRYGFHLGTNFFDYPHIAVWPDAYYMSDNVFNSSGTAFLGPQPFAFDRAKMLAGLPATFVSPGITGGPAENPYHPADLDGSTLPPANAPATFVEWPGGGTYKVFHFHADFAVPGNTTFTLFASPAAAGFTELCPSTRSCIPQLGSADGLDGLGDRFMHRLAYRNFGAFESVVGNFSVSSGGVSGIRWFELRNVTAGPVTVFQQSTYQPDATWRWMGSAAQDKLGNLAIGFSASSATIFPQIRYAGRLSSDPINTLGAGGSPSVRRHGQPDGHRQPLGRLQRPDSRSGGRLHLLVHPGVLRDDEPVQLAHAHRELQVRQLHRDSDTGGRGQRRDDHGRELRASKQRHRPQRDGHGQLLSPEYRHRSDDESRRHAAEHRRGNGGGRAADLWRDRARRDGLHAVYVHRDRGLRRRPHGDDSPPGRRERSRQRHLHIYARRAEHGYRVLPELRRRGGAGAARRMDDGRQRGRVSVGDVHDDPCQRAQRRLRAGPGQCRPHGAFLSGHRAAGRLLPVDLQEQLQHGGTYDGMVLEISIAGGAFQDILAAGGSFVSGGYNSTIATGVSAIRSPDGRPGPATPAATSPRRRTCRPRPAGRTSS